jgi:hypothetical protein
MSSLRVASSPREVRAFVTERAPCVEIGFNLMCDVREMLNKVRRG